MDELTMLREFRASEPGPSAVEAESARAALLAVIRTGRPSRGGRVPGSDSRRPRRDALAAAWSGLAAATAVAIPVALAAIVTGPAPHSGSLPGGPARQMTAPQLLSKIADVAASARFPAVTDSQFEYIATEVSDSTRHGSTSRGLTARRPTHARQIWIPVADLCRSGLLVENGLRFFTPAHDIELSSGGSGPAQFSGPAQLSEPAQADHAVLALPASCPDRGGLADPTYRLLQSLPANPHALLKMIYAAHLGGQSPGREAFTTIGDLLRESIAPPQVSATLYRAAALIPGVRVIPAARDAIGRPGVAVSYAFRGAQQEWIFSKTTLQLLGERDVSKRAVEDTAIITRAFTSRPGQVPSAG
jgi:hypothetical protein